MESQMRPSKMRKLSHSAQDDGPPARLVSEEVEALIGRPEEGPSRREQNTPSEHSDDEDAADTAGLRSGANAPIVSQTPSGEDGIRTDQPEMSKNQRKKLAKKEEWEAGREYRKAKRKEKIQNKKIRDRVAKAQAQAHEEKDRTTNNENATQEQNLGDAKENGNYTAKRRGRKFTRLPVTLLIDCGFDDLMMEKERISLGSQLTRSYSDNHRAALQAHLYISSWGGLLKERFDTLLDKHHENWKGVVFTEKDFLAASEMAKEAMLGKGGGKLAGVFTKYASRCPVPMTKNVVVVDGEPAAEKTIGREDSKGEDLQVNQLKVHVEKLDPNEAEEQAGDGYQAPSDVDSEEIGVPVPSNDLPNPQEGEIVYLTSDSPYTLNELKPYSTYIIGGLVDKNRHKGICYKTACEKGLKTAKLPIGEFMQMQSRFVLATNHVVEIMVRWLECGDWGEAFTQVIPKRKGGTLKETSGDANSTKQPNSDGGISDGV